MLPKENEFKYFLEYLISRGTNKNINQYNVSNLIKKYDMFARFSALANYNLDSDKTNFTIKKNTTEIIANHLLQENFIRKLGRLCLETNIEVYLLKSTAFNGWIYESENPRGNSDIDIFVDSFHYEKLKVILNSLALQIKESKNPFTNSYEQTWLVKNTTLYIDLHSRLVNPYVIDINNSYVSHNSVPHPYYKNAALRVMSDEMNLIHLCIHIFKDGYIPHHSLIDAAFLIDKNNINWALVDSMNTKFQTKKIFNYISYNLEKVGVRTVNQKKGKVKLLNLKAANVVMKKQLQKESMTRRIQQFLLLILLMDKPLKAVNIIIKYLFLKMKSSF